MFHCEQHMCDFQSRTAYEKHISLHKMETNFIIRDDYVICRKCKRDFDDRKNALEHVQIHNIIELSISRDFCTISDFNLVQCNICNKKINAIELDSHIYSHRDIRIGFVYRWSGETCWNLCRICGIQYYADKPTKHTECIEKWLRFLQRVKNQRIAFAVCHKTENCSVSLLDVYLCKQIISLI